jgi:NADH dehydrogenase
VENELKKQRIVILGAGYAGLKTAVELQNRLGMNEAEVLLINQNTYHYETTWLHEASAGTLHHDAVRFSIRDVIDMNVIRFLEGTVEEIIPKKKCVRVGNQEIPYDILVIALGAESETFGIKGIAEYAFGITNVNQARKIRDHIGLQFATYHAEGSNKKERLTIIVGGAGFTGIEFLGELGNRIPELCREYDIDPRVPRIVCVEALPSILPGFDTSLVHYALEKLMKKGIEFKLGSKVTEVTPEGIQFQTADGTSEFIPSKTIVWAAGVRGNRLIESTGIPNARNRVQVDEYLRAPGNDNILIIGDCSLMINPETNRPYPPTAQIAMQQAVDCAYNIIATIRGKSKLRTFVPQIKGTVCSLGDDDGVGIILGKKIVGRSAAFMKKIVDNRALYLLGGIPLVIKKGKWNTPFFCFQYFYHLIISIRTFFCS